MIDAVDDQVKAKDTVELLLEGRTHHPIAQKLLDFHRAKRTFFLEFAAELFWLKKRGRSISAEVLLQYLRGDKRWHGVDVFMVTENVLPLLTRMCILLYPALNNAKLELHQCEADQILGTDVVPGRGKNKGTMLLARESTRLELAQLPPPPPPPAVQRRSRRHRTVTAEEAAWVFPYIKELIACSPHPRNHVLQLLSRHAKSQPEVFALAQRKLEALIKRPHRFIVRSIFTDARQTVQRVKGEARKRFTLPHDIAPLYDRAAIRRNPQLNGWTLFREDGKGKLRKGHANALLDCTLAPKPLNGEPYRRLTWKEAGQ